MYHSSSGRDRLLVPPVEYMSKMLISRSPMLCRKKRASKSIFRHAKMSRQSALFSEPPSNDQYSQRKCLSKASEWSKRKLVESAPGTQ